jgi:hypothetical protein
MVRSMGLREVGSAANAAAAGAALATAGLAAGTAYAATHAYNTLFKPSDNQEKGAAGLTAFKPTEKQGPAGLPGFTAGNSSIDMSRLPPSASVVDYEAWLQGREGREDAELKLIKGAPVTAAAPTEKNVFKAEIMPNGRPSLPGRSSAQLTLAAPKQQVTATPSAVATLPAPRSRETKKAAPSETNATGTVAGSSSTTTSAPFTEPICATSRAITVLRDDT